MIRRFTVRAVIISVVASGSWWLTRGVLGRTTVAGAKWLHAAIGYPAPYLEADRRAVFWFAPLFPLLAGLVLASGWRSWSRRLIGLVLALAAFWYVVSVQVALVYSPYLTQSTVRAYLSEIQVGLNTVAFPVVLWLIVTGGPPRLSSAAVARMSAADASVAPVERTPRAGRAIRPVAKTSRAGVSGRSGRPMPLPAAVVVLLLFCALCTAPLVLAAEQSTPNLDAARQRLARALVAGDDAAALAAIDDMFGVQRQNEALRYLRVRLQARAATSRGARNRGATSNVNKER